MKEVLKMGATLQVRLAPQLQEKPREEAAGMRLTASALARYAIADYLYRRCGASERPDPLGEGDPAENGVGQHG
jgi:hypothetical protein